MTDQSSFVSYWQRAAADLGLEIVAPFTVRVADASFEIPVLLRNFGGRLGMLLTTDYQQLKLFASALVDAGYGYSVLSDPNAEETYSREGILEVLTDWGWTGSDHERPAWLPGPPASDD
jgi:hypothetical protein